MLQAAVLDVGEPTDLLSRTIPHFKQHFPHAPAVDADPNARPHLAPPLAGSISGISVGQFSERIAPHLKRTLAAVGAAGES